MDTVPKSSSEPNTTNRKLSEPKPPFGKSQRHSYNPFEHRHLENTSGDIRSLANLVKASLGSGILAMPLAFANAGWLVGIVGTMIIAAICAHSVHIFVQVSRGCCKVEKKPLLGYAETCRSTFVNGPESCRRFAKAAFMFAEFSLLFTYLGICCIYSVLIADSIKQPFDRYVFSVSPPVEYYCLAIIIPLCIMTQIKQLKWLAPFSLIANFLLVATFAICLYYIFREKIVFSDKQMVGHLSRFPAYLSTVIFAMEGIGVVMPIENAMKYPQHFLECPSVLVVAMTIIMLLYTVLGLFGYFRYGDVLRGSITLNLPIDDWPAVGAKLFIAISIFFTYPLNFFVAMDTVLRFCKPHIIEKYHFFAEIILRIVVVCFCSGLGIALPMMEYIISIVGALFYSILGLIIPGIIQTVFQWRNLGRDIRSLANLVKASLGSGILAMPLAFANAGWLVGIVGTMIIAAICAHCVHIFVKVSHGCCIIEKKPLLGYAETCRSTFANGPESCRRFAKAAYVFAEFSLLFTYLGVCCIFTVLIADSLKQPFDRYVFSVSPPIEYYCLAIIIPLCIMAQIKHLKWLAPFSLLANILLVATFAICLYYIFGAEIVFTEKRMMGDITRFPAYLSTVIFAMEGIGVVMPVENAMKKPQHFLGCPSVLTVAMTFIMVLYMILGLFGYLRYGDVLRGSITLNLPIDDWPAVGAKFFIATSIFFTYPLHFYVVIDTLFRFLKPYILEKYHTIAEITLRIAVVCFCGGIGIALPMLEQIINIVGALFYSILGLIIPGVVQTVFLWRNLGRYKWVLWKNLFLVAFGLLALVSGCVVTVNDIMTAYCN